MYLKTNKRKHEDVLGITFEVDNEKKKRHRRTAHEIARHYKCPIEDCPKSYGSEGSLNQHIKIKHPEYYQEMIQQNNANQSMADLGQLGAAMSGIQPNQAFFNKSGNTDNKHGPDLGKANQNNENSNKQDNSRQYAEDDYEDDEGDSQDDKNNGSNEY